MLCAGAREADGANNAIDKNPHSGCMGGMWEGFLEEEAPEWTDGAQLSFQDRWIMGRRQEKRC